VNTSRRVTGYDLFKLIVAIVLFILFLLFNRKAIPNAPPPIFTPFSNQNPTTVPATQRTGATDSVISSPTLMEAASLTATAQPTITGTGAVEATATPLPSPTPASLPQPTETSLPSLTPVPVVSTPETGAAALSACDAASSHSRLQAGGKAVLLRRLNFRSSPGIQHNWLRTNLPGTQVEVVDGPQCIPYVSGAYVWWQIKLPDGEIGWSAETSQFGTFYFMEPGE